MAWLLGVGDALMPGTGLYVLFVATLIFGSFLALTWARSGASWAAAAVAALFVLTPQFLLYPAVVWKDVLFAALAVAGVACLALTEASWSRAPLRLALLAASFVFVVLAALARQNGVIVLAGAAVALSWIVARNGSPARGLIWGAVGLAAAVAAMLAVS